MPLYEDKKGCLCVRDFTPPDKVSRVFMICNAYESGVGHGRKKDGLPNPYPNKSEEHEAYEIGYKCGAGITTINIEPVQ